MRGGRCPWPLVAAVLLGAAWLPGAVPTIAQEPSKDAPPQAVATTLTLFAGTPAGLWRTRDWGARWERVEGATTANRLDGLGAARAIVPQGPQVWVGGDGGVFVSYDFGETWVQQSTTAGIRSLLFSRWPQSDLTAFAGTANGLLKSADLGRSFKPTGLAGAPVSHMDWPGPALLLATGYGLVLSDDGGQTFTGAGESLPRGEMKAFVLSAFFAVDPVIFAAPASGGVYRSGDRGKTWTSAGLAGETVGDLVWLGPFLYAAAEGALFRSEDAGATWARLGAYEGRPVRLLFPLAPAAGLEAFVATDRGIFRTADGGQRFQPSGLAGEDVLTVATFPPPAPLQGKKVRR
jgi:photosystem II stability/assembly factor-like uncharacterized protein